MKVLISNSELNKLTSSQQVPLECYNCKSTFHKNKGTVQRGLKGRRAVKFCNLKCAGEYKTKQGTFQTECSNCNSPLTKHNKDISSSGNNFCNKSCAAKFTNKKRILLPKKNSKGGRRSLKNICTSCGKYGKNLRNRLCKDCKITNNVHNFGREKSISDFSSTYARHRYQGIRNHAHRVANLSGLNKVCGKIDCNYSLHVELCHVNPIHSFPKHTKLEVVNSIDNLIYLCRNHHWELENNFLDIGNLKR